VDLILVTHAHFDHFADAPALAKLHNAPMYGPAGMNQTVAASASCRPSWRRASARAAPSCPSARPA
jgi:glyoxylase-like metal-dependent hydrolase (beta-lactamase superfamily II)